jgi:predicted anti-sigma-YlaC factor YlaD
MPCMVWGDLLLDYSELPADERQAADAHLAGCADCREYLETMAHLETGLVELYSGTKVSPAFRSEVRACLNAGIGLEQPSVLPEVLDFIGWAGIIAAIVCLAWLLPHQLSVVSYQLSVWHSGNY